MPKSNSKGGEGGGGAVAKNFFLALRASVWSKIKGRAGPPGPSPGSATGIVLKLLLNGLSSRPHESG